MSAPTRPAVSLTTEHRARVRADIANLPETTLATLPLVEAVRALWPGWDLLTEQSNPVKAGFVLRHPTGAWAAQWIFVMPTRRHGCGWEDLDAKERYTRLLGSTGWEHFYAAADAIGLLTLLADWTPGTEPSHAVRDLVTLIRDVAHPEVIAAETMLALAGDPTGLLGLRRASF